MARARTVAKNLFKYVEWIAEPGAAAHAPHATFEPRLTISVVNLFLLVVTEDLIPASLAAKLHGNVHGKTITRIEGKSLAISTT